MLVGVTPERDHSTRITDPQLHLRRAGRRTVPAVSAQAREAEASGFDTVLVMDHFYQLPGIGDPRTHAGGYTALGALATRPRAVKLSAGDREHLPQPDLAGQDVTTWTSSARGARSSVSAPAGSSGAPALGFEFDTSPSGSRSSRRRCRSSPRCCTASEPRFCGTYYHTESAINEPATGRHSDHARRQRGEEEFRMAAQYADHLNIICDRADVGRKGGRAAPSAARRSAVTRQLWKPARC